MENARAHLVISGRVQGVFFRSFTEQLAYSKGLKGWVRNCTDGNVEAVFEGKRPDIEEAIILCRMGPPASKVDDINIKWEDFKDEFKTFSVRYF
jgi:acylphosphatase